MLQEDEHARVVVLYCSQGRKCLKALDKSVASKVKGREKMKRVFGVKKEKELPPPPIGDASDRVLSLPFFLPFVLFLDFFLLIFVLEHIMGKI